jgi:hypothetical protein
MNGCTVRPMAMNWLKGLVAPAAQYGAQQIAQQGQQPGAPPVGGMPSPYGAGPPQDQPMPFGMQPGAPQGTGVPGAMEWSVGTKTQGQAGGISGGGISGGGISGGGAQTLEARCVQLQHDVDSLALFARTLLTLLETKNVVTRVEFEETKKQLDMLDGKLDDR